MLSLAAAAAVVVVVVVVDDDVILIVVIVFILVIVVRDHGPTRQVGWVGELFFKIHRSIYPNSRQFPKKKKKKS
jgi:hypothetical protein